MAEGGAGPRPLLPGPLPPPQAQPPGWACCSALICPARASFPGISGGGAATWPEDAHLQLFLNFVASPPLTVPYFLHLGAGPWEERNDPSGDPGFCPVGPGAQQETQPLPFPLRSGSGGVG